MYHGPSFSMIAVNSLRTLHSTAARIVRTALQHWASLGLNNARLTDLIGLKRCSGTQLPYQVRISAVGVWPRMALGPLAVRKLNRIGFRTSCSAGESRSRANRARAHA